MRTREQNRARTAAWRKANPVAYKEHQRRWREKHRDAINAKARLRPDRRRRRALGIDQAAFDRLFASQGSACGICRTNKSRKWVLDHNHTTGAARGVLCNRCNLGLGLLQDEAGNCRAAAQYLDFWSLM